MRYLPPARIDDFERSGDPDKLKDEWHRRIKDQIDQYRNLSRFLDPLDADASAALGSFPWTGFPRIFDAWLDIENHPHQIERAHRSAEMLNRFVYVKFQDDFFRVPADPDNGWMLFARQNGGTSMSQPFALAERPQDEYLEWHVVREPMTNKVTRIDFTVEAPEYWETLAEGDPDLASKLYSELLGNQVPTEDLFFRGDILCPELVRVGNAFAVSGHVPLFPNRDDFKAGQYNRWNLWNTERGAVHLTQRANTLFAEINLAARATQRFAVRQDLGSNVDRFTLTACGGYGSVNRNSDPTIGEAVNTLALSGFRAMVANPIGLYIGEVDLSGFRDPSGEPVERDKIFTLLRGSFEDEDGLPRVLRFSVHPPDNAGYTLEECTFDGHVLNTGGPIARKTTVVIHGTAMPAQSSHPVVNCEAITCEHPTKRPIYFLAVPPESNCPPPNAPDWQDPPVPIAPDATNALAGALTTQPRSSGSRS
ncbi:MAG: hypothetical protein QNJ92_01840 [Alphaproteobacteria bacterium]|nr:hypothetical protein [Alphaproteobacteria bacterium]